jgi:hypothetical protein
MTLKLLGILARVVFLSAPFGFVLLAADAANAAPITFDVTAVYAGATQTGDNSIFPDFGSGLTVGQTVFGSFSYDPLSTPSIPFTPPFILEAVYTFGTISLTLPSQTLAGGNGVIGLAINNGSGLSQLSITHVVNVATPSPQEAGYNVEIFLRGALGVINPLSLPTSFNLADYTVAQFTIGASDYYNTGNPNTGYYVGQEQFTFNITDITAVAATPLPAALPLFASGLGAMGLIGWRRKRKTTAAIAA